LSAPRGSSGIATDWAYSSAAPARCKSANRPAYTTATRRLRVAPKARVPLDDRERQYRIEQAGAHQGQDALFGQPRVAAIPLEVVVGVAHERAALERNGRARQPADAACAGPHEILVASVLIRARVEFAKAHEGDADRGSAVAEAMTVPSGEKAKVVEPP
jgi:hypothetical protein